MAPASKSHVQRAVALSLISSSSTRLLGYTECDDSEVSLRTASEMGAAVSRHQAAVDITPGDPKSQAIVLDMGGSGTSMRLFTGLGTVTPCLKYMTGSPQLIRRPMHQLLDALERLGAKFKPDETGIWVYPTGLNGGEAPIDQSISSQFTSSIMIASTKARDEVDVRHLREPVSKGYILITAEVMRTYGASVSVSEDLRVIRIKPSRLHGVDMKIEGDYSSASFLLAAGALGGDVTVANLKPDSLQPDRRILDILSSVGCKVSRTDDRVRVSADRLEAFEISVDESPDIAPVAAVLACYAKGTSLLKDVDRLRYKESDRVSSIIHMLSSIGVSASVSEEGIRIQGGEVQGGVVDAHGDHRIALSAAVAGIRSKKPVVVDGFECHTKSYPTFLSDWSALGGQTRLG